MEPAKINWQTLESVFVRDDTYENINAPQWIDFSAPHASSLDDDAWFCKPDCKHPKTAEDFLKSTPTSKLLRSVAVSKLIALGDWSRIKETSLKRRVPPATEDGENQNPNLETPLSQHIKPAKAAIKSSAEKPRESNEEYIEIPLHSDETPKLKSVLSGRDLFAGRDLLGKITDFCTELKKLAIARAKEKDRDDESDKVDAKMSLLDASANKEHAVLGDLSTKMNDKETKERKPFLVVSKDSVESGVRSPLGEKPRKKITRGDNAENTPLSLDVKNNTKGKDMGESLQAAIRTSPPTPQCFSVTREPFKTMASKAPKSRLNKQEREPFQEMQLKQVLKEAEVVVVGEKSNGRSPLLPSLSAGKDGGRTLDVFWFFKPCAHSSTEF